MLVGLGLSGGSFTIVIAALGRLVPEDRRSWAMGMATAAGSLGQFLFAPLGQAFISGYGWATALVMLAAFAAVVPALAVALRGGTQPEDEETSLPARAGRGGGVWSRGAICSLMAGFFVCGFHIGFITTHLPPYLTDAGVSPRLAAWSLALIGLFNVLGSYGAGVLGGRVSKRRLLTVIYLSRAAAIALFITLPKSPAVVLAFAAALGVCGSRPCRLPRGSSRSCSEPATSGPCSGLYFSATSWGRSSASGLAGSPTRRPAATPRCGGPASHSPSFPPPSTGR